MRNQIDNTLDDLKPIFKTIDDCLTEWKGDGNLQFPTLIGMIALKLSWDDKQLREHDAIVRFYVRKHPDWHVTRGAHGGIMPATEKHKRDAIKIAKEIAKNQVKDAVAAKLVTTKAIDIKSVDNDDDADDSDSE